MPTTAAVDPRSLIPRGRTVTLQNARWITSTIPIRWVGGVILPPGTQYKAFTNTSGGYFCLRSPVNGRQFIWY